MKYTKIGVRVGPSKHGQGVFALRRFTEGEQLGPLQGDIIDDPNYGSDYGIELGERTLEPAATFRFLNHHCEPNCLLVMHEAEDDPSDLEIWLEILRDIEPGEQLTIDYGWPAEAAIPCGCGAASCRGWIVAKEVSLACGPR